ncbi:hypothetical protein CLV62_14610 [Dysgonomonas alginatilytica]|uniref:Uncharacterized protein n=1 Tax=Dysgonomonas alginatilytica TaxID=1605892 RepID=A0A2V3PKF2_9BACT|nr:hypothetical protein CLV62_14610 [Dysgonomonas alginatilytica]
MPISVKVDIPIITPKFDTPKFKKLTNERVNELL